MGEEKEQRSVSSNIYWSGAFIAFGIPFLGIEALGLIYGVSPSNSLLLHSYQSVIIFLYVIGGMLGGYLVTQRSSVGWTQGGIVTGDNFTMAGLILGSILGAFIADYLDKRIKNDEALEEDDSSV